MNGHMLADDMESLSQVEGVLTYVKPMTEKHIYYPHPFDPPAGIPRYNATLEPHSIAIHDVRPIADRLEFHRDGFVLTKHSTAVTDFYDDEEVHRVYDEEAKRLVAQTTGAARVVVFDRVSRRREQTETAPKPAVESKRPFDRIHGDYTMESGRQRVRDLMGEEAESLLQRPFNIVNIWRPIRGPLRDAPLAICTARSVAPADLVTCEVIYPDRKGEICAVTYNPAHRWFYAPDMQADEAFLFKTFDSEQNGCVRVAPHTAFKDPTPFSEVPPRESFEIRAFAFFT
jgi:hypothetical protein